MAYSFQDVTATIVGVGGSINLGNEAGVAEEGISITLTEDKNQMTIGADGTPMHTLVAGNGGTVTVRLQRTSPVNALLSAMFNLQRANSSAWGKNVITVRRANAQDDITCTLCAFKKWPDLTFAKGPNIVEWTWDAGRVDGFLGAEG